MPASHGAANDEPLHEAPHANRSGRRRTGRKPFCTSQTGDAVSSQSMNVLTRSTPGAAQSTHGPWFAKSAITPRRRIAVTATTRSSAAGNRGRDERSLPAAAITTVVGGRSASACAIAAGMRSSTVQPPNDMLTTSGGSCATSTSAAATSSSKTVASGWKTARISIAASGARRAIRPAMNVPWPAAATRQPAPSSGPGSTVAPVTRASSSGETPAR